MFGQEPIFLSKNPPNTNFIQKQGTKHPQKHPYHTDFYQCPMAQYLCSNKGGNDD